MFVRQELILSVKDPYPSIQFTEVLDGLENIQKE